MLPASDDCVPLPGIRHNPLTRQLSLHDHALALRLIEPSVSEPSVSTPTLIRHFLHRGTRNTCSMMIETHDCVSLPDPRLDLCSSLTHQSSLRDNALAVRLIESSVSEPSVSTPTLIRHFLRRGTRNT